MDQSMLKSNILKFCLIFLSMFHFSCQKEHVQNYDPPPCAPRTINYWLPDECNGWLDSLALLNGRFITANSNNGLTESYQIRYYGSFQYYFDRIKKGDCEFSYQSQMHQIYYRPTLWDIQFSLSMEFYNSINFNDTDFIVKDPCIGLRLDKIYYKMFSDIANSRFYYQYPDVGLISKNGWVNVGSKEINGHLYSEVYYIFNLVQGKFASLYLDKHFGIIQFTTSENVIWNINYE